ncbi:hypothetical protein LINGRAPRIM_LOCUS3061 [Linum grandiflorum]
MIKVRFSIHIPILKVKSPYMYDNEQVLMMNCKSAPKEIWARTYIAGQN